MAPHCAVTRHAAVADHCAVVDHFSAADRSSAADRCVVIQIAVADHCVVADRDGPAAPNVAPHILETLSASVQSVEPVVIRAALIGAQSAARLGAQLDARVVVPAA